MGQSVAAGPALRKATGTRWPLLRLTMEPSAKNGLRTTSQVMIDRPMAVKADRLGSAFGRLDDTSMVRVNRSLVFFLGLAG